MGNCSQNCTNNNPLLESQISSRFHTSSSLLVVINCVEEGSEAETQLNGNESSDGLVLSLTGSCAVAETIPTAYTLNFLLRFKFRKLLSYIFLPDTVIPWDPTALFLCFLDFLFVTI